MRQWISEEEIVRVVGYGRALLAAAIPANRLHHCGARVYIQHDRVPLPNSSRGGAILAASASGRTQAILDLLRRAKKLNPEIRIVGIADKSAPEFAQLCDIFVGIDLAYNPLLNPLHALADTGEYIISELLDAMVVAAARQAGLTEDDIRRGHEDLVDTGPHHQHES
jgi:D-arabinose 5-phosphate isomerase GutQ